MKKWKKEDGTKKHKKRQKKTSALGMRDTEKEIKRIKQRKYLNLWKNKSFFVSYWIYNKKKERLNKKWWLE